jgi:hypothetical protein
MDDFIRIVIIVSTDLSMKLKEPVTLQVEIQKSERKVMQIHSVGI